MIFSRSVPLAELTSLRVGGRAAHVADARTPRDLEEALRFSHKRGVPHFILGEGTNVFASDRDFPGVVVRVKSRGVSLSRERGAVILEAAAGENFDRLIRRAVGLGLSGLENLSGIPGTAGATPIQNVGAYGVEIKDVVARVEALDAECGALRVFSPEECGFRYRASFFQSPAGKRFVITRVALRLSECFRPVLSYPELAARVSGRKLALRSVRRAILAIRRRKFPDLRQTGTAGSFFKNPVLSPAKAARAPEALPGHPDVSRGKRRQNSPRVDPRSRFGAQGVPPRRRVSL